MRSTIELGLQGAGGQVLQRIAHHWPNSHFNLRGTVASVLTYRGEERALELLRFFDSDFDDKLDFADFCGYLEYFDRYVSKGYSQSAGL